MQLNFVNTVPEVVIACSRPSAALSAHRKVICSYCKFFWASVNRIKVSGPEDIIQNSQRDLNKSVDTLSVNFSEVTLEISNSIDIDCKFDALPIIVPSLHDDVIKWKHFPRYCALWGEFTGDRSIPSQRPVTRSFDAELWFFLSPPEQTVE